jgi:hypothetical protein
MFEQCSRWWITREWRGKGVFLVNSGNADIPAPNKWHRVKIWDEFPAEARFAWLFCMYVGGTQKYPNNFFFYVDWRDPDTPESEWGDPASWGDKKDKDPTDTNTHGGFYVNYNDTNERYSLGCFPVPCKNREIVLRWKIEFPEAMTQGAAYGVNLMALAACG